MAFHVIYNFASVSRPRGGQTTPLSDLSRYARRHNELRLKACDQAVALLCSYHRMLTLPTACIRQVNTGGLHLRLRHVCCCSGGVSMFSYTTSLEKCFIVASSHCTFNPHGLAWRNRLSVQAVNLDPAGSLSKWMPLQTFTAPRLQDSQD